MKCLAIEKFGGVEVLKQMDLPKPVPNENQILVKISHAGVNPVDWKIREGYLQQMLPHEFPIILGWDAAGTVESVGSGVSKYKAGDNVYGYCRKPIVKEGCYAEYIVVDEEALAFSPKNIDLAHASSIPLAGLTAWQSLFDFGDLQQGQTALIHAGAGGVGSLAIQFAKWKGATVYTTASAKNRDYVKSLGADHVIDYTKENFVDVIQKDVAAGVDLVYDTVGGETLKNSFAVVKHGGVVVTIVDTPSQEQAQEKNVKAGFVFVSPNSAQLQQITELMEQGIVQPLAIDIMKLEKGGEALTLNQKRHVRGKIVLEIE